MNWEDVDEDYDGDAEDLNYHYEWSASDEDDPVLEEEEGSGSTMDEQRLGLPSFCHANAGVRSNGGREYDIRIDGSVARGLGNARGGHGRGDGEGAVGLGRGDGKIHENSNGGRGHGGMDAVLSRVRAATQGRGDGGDAGDAGGGERAPRYARLGLTRRVRARPALTRWHGEPGSGGGLQPVGLTGQEHTTDSGHSNIDMDENNNQHNENGEDETIGSEEGGDDHGGGHAHNGNRGANGIVKAKRRHYEDHEKLAIYAMLLERTQQGILSKGVSLEVAEACSVPLRTIQNIWKRGKKAGGIQGILSKRPNRCGRKRKEFNEDAVKEVDLSKRTTLRDLANELHMSKTTLWRRLKEGKLRRHTNAIKSTLTESNKLARIRFCLSMFDDQSIPEDPTFKDMYNVIHIDEKWFYRTRVTQNYYLAPSEEEPFRCTQSKGFIEKVMFLAAVARPRYDADGNMTFDGKIGIWPFTFEDFAIRGSKNRSAGTLVTKVLPAVTQNVSREYMVNKLLLAIKEKWPASERGYPIFVQQDNARTHIPLDDPAFCAAAQADGWDIRLTCQPPNSPDLNILDLGFFAALQALFHKMSPGKLADIVAKVREAYNEYPEERSNRI